MAHHAPLAMAPRRASFPAVLRPGGTAAAGTPADAAALRAAGAAGKVSRD